MSELELAIWAVLLSAVSYVAYTLARWGLAPDGGPPAKRRDGAAGASVPKSSRSSSAADASSGSSSDARPTRPAGEEVTAKSGKKVVADEEAASKSKPGGAADATSASGAAKELAPGETPKRDLINVSFTDEEDELDITRVGPKAKAPAQPAKRVVYQPPIQTIAYDDGATVEEPTGVTSLFLVNATAQTDKGLRRKNNEDSLLVLESCNLFAVADGMGGYKGGELASRLAIEAIADAAKSKQYEGPAHESLPREASELARAIQMANASIREAAAKEPELDGMGTTICAARFSPNKSRMFIGHVGDSRCYRLRDGVLKAMTADHTMADYGITGPESAHLSRAVGIWPTMPIDIVLSVPKVGDVYLLCSDGLTKMLPDDTIANVLRAEEDLKVAVDRLILFANSKGGKDNVTVILVRVVPPDWKPKVSAQA